VLSKDWTTQWNGAKTNTLTNFAKALTTVKKVLLNMSQGRQLNGRLTILDT
jgi:hypothetical protein